jgi:hypothetical protein
LFNFVGDVLYKMLENATRKGLILLGDFRSGGIVSLQYADYTLLFSSTDERCLRNLKGVLMLFESFRDEDQLS